MTVVEHVHRMFNNGLVESLDFGQLVEIGTAIAIAPDMIKAKRRCVKVFTSADYMWSKLQHGLLGRTIPDFWYPMIVSFPYMDTSAFT